MTEHKPVGASGVKAPPYYREEVWNKLSRVYDALVKLGLLPFGGEKRLRKRFADFANLGKGEQVLDVCSGTGTLTSLIADRVGSSGRVVGVDLSPKMIEIARERVKNSAVSFRKANAEHLPFPDDVFDKAFVSFGLHEMPESARQNTLKEIYRTLKPSGSLVVLDYNLPRGAFARFVIKAFVKLLEEEFAYKMLLDGSLTAEVEEAGLAIERQGLICGGMIQMIQARKAYKGDNDG